MRLPDYTEVRTFCACVFLSTIDFISFWFELFMCMCWSDFDFVGVFEANSCHRPTFSAIVCIRFLNSVLNNKTWWNKFLGDSWFIKCAIPNTTLKFATHPYIQRSSGAIFYHASALHDRIDPSIFIRLCIYSLLIYVVHILVCLNLSVINLSNYQTTVAHNLDGFNVLVCNESCPSTGNGIR